ncbi:hypothetical protein JTB14_030414 [Gonioctena quinquepunctata]|nr:hypothetical protein JTB14_030414 [Gonioctena quinquepunctata]
MTRKIVLPNIIILLNKLVCNNIREAIKDYTDFDWGYISLCFPQEWARFETAVRTVGGNQYYGFRKELGDAKSTNFKSLAWVAKELLIKAGGKTSLSRYSGWVGLIAHQNAITDRIDAYVRGKAEAITPEMVDARRENAAYLATLASIKYKFSPVWSLTGLARPGSPLLKWGKAKIIKKFIYANYSTFIYYLNFLSKILTKSHFGEQRVNFPQPNPLRNLQQLYLETPPLLLLQWIYPVF